MSKYDRSTVQSRAFNHSIAPHYHVAIYISQSLPREHALRTFIFGTHIRNQKPFILFVNITFTHFDF